MSIRTLVSTDGSEPSRKTLRFVARLAHPLPLKVTLVHALHLQSLEYKMIPDFQVEMIQEGAKRAARALLEKEIAFLTEQGVEADSRLIFGAPGSAICEFAEKEKVALVALGRRGHGDLQDLMFGSVSNHVVHHCGLPVLVVKKAGPEMEPEGYERPVRTLVAVDGSEPSSRCLDFLASLDEARKGLQLTLMRVVNPDQPGLEHLPHRSRYEALIGMHRQAEEKLAEDAQRLRDLGFKVDTRVEEGTAGKTICRVYDEDEYEMICMGRRGLGEIKDVLFGAVCHFVVHHCPGHVLVVP